MVGYFSLPNTNAYTFDWAGTAKHSHPVRQLPGGLSSHPTTPGVPVYTPGTPDPDLRVPTLLEGTPGFDEALVRRGKDVYFIAKVHSPGQVAPGLSHRPGLQTHGWNGDGEGLRRGVEGARRRAGDAQRFAWQVQAPFTVDVVESAWNYYEGKTADVRNGCEPDGRGYECGSSDERRINESSPSPSSDADSDVENGYTGFPSSSAALGFPGNTPTPPPFHATGLLMGPSQVEAATASRDYFTARYTSAAAGLFVVPFVLPSPSGKTSMPLHIAPAQRMVTAGLPEPMQQPACQCRTCLHGLIEFTGGKERGTRLLQPFTTNVDRRAEETRSAAAPPLPLPAADVPAPPPMVAADWSVSWDLAILGVETNSTPLPPPTASRTLVCSRSTSSFFSETQDTARAGSDTESEDEPLAETVKRRRATRVRSVGQGTGTAPQDPPGDAALESSDSVEIPLHVLCANKQETAKRSASTSRGSSPTSSSASAQQGPESRKRKRGPDEETEEGEISRSESDSDSEPDSEPEVPLTLAVSARRSWAGRKALGHGAPPTKKLKSTPVTDEARRTTPKAARQRKSWAHKRWEERLTQAHGLDGRRGIRIISTDEDLLRKGIGREGVGDD